MNTERNWRHIKETMNGRLGYILKSKLHTDCEFVVGVDKDKKTFKAHKIILVTASPVFEAMFFGDLAEKGSVVIPDIQPRGFDKMLEYIYTNTTTFKSIKEACFTYCAANKYLIQKLMQICEEHCLTYNALECYEWGQKFNISTLEKEGLRMLQDNIEELLKTTDFKNINLSTIVMILNNQSLNISSEVPLFNMVRQYAEGRITKTPSTKEQSDVFEENIKCQEIKQLVKKIRFLTMSATEFAEGPCSTDLLTQDEKYSILMNIISANPPKMPSGFNNNKTFRNSDA